MQILIFIQRKSVYEAHNFLEISVSSYGLFFWKSTMTGVKAFAVK